MQEWNLPKALPGHSGGKMTGRNKARRANSPLGQHQHQEASRTVSGRMWFPPFGKRVPDSHWNSYASRCATFSKRLSTNPSRRPWVRPPPSTHLFLHPYLLEPSLPTPTAHSPNGARRTAMIATINVRTSCCTSTNPVNVPVVARRRVCFMREVSFALSYASNFLIDLAFGLPALGWQSKLDNPEVSLGKQSVDVDECIAMIRTRTRPTNDAELNW